MRPLVLVTLLALGACEARVAPPPAPAAPESPAEDPTAAPAPPAPGPALPPPIRELSDPVPADVKIDVHREGAAFRVRVHRRGHLVALRRLDMRNAGSDEASLPVLGGELGDAPLIWETTGLRSLETTRGVLHLGADGEPHALLAETPTPVPREERLRHRCWSYPDGAGGSTVLCHITTFAKVVDVTSPDRHDGAWVVPNTEGSLARLDLPAHPDSVEARLVSYIDNSAAVVLRAESSFLTGESAPSLTVLSAERDQQRTQRAFMKRPMSSQPLRLETIVAD